MDTFKEVRFDKYCESCKFFCEKETHDPCNDCLAESSNTESEKPIFWKENKR